MMVAIRRLVRAGSVNAVTVRIAGLARQIEK